MVEKVHSLNPKPRNIPLLHPFDTASKAYDTRYLYDIHAPKPKFSEEKKESWLKGVTVKKGPILNVLYKIIKGVLISLIYPFYATLYILPKAIYTYLKKITKKPLHIISGYLKIFNQKLNNFKINPFKLKIRFSFKSFSILKAGINQQKEKLKRKFLSFFKPLFSLKFKVIEKVRVIKEKLKNLMEKVRNIGRSISLYCSQIKEKSYKTSLRMYEKGKSFLKRILEVIFSKWNLFVQREKKAFENFLSKIKKVTSSVFILGKLFRTLYLKIAQACRYMSEVFSYPVLGFNVIAETVVGCFSKIGVAITRFIKSFFSIGQRLKNAIIKMIQSVFSYLFHQFYSFYEKLNNHLKIIKLPKMTFKKPNFKRPSFTFNFKWKGIKVPQKVKAFSLKVKDIYQAALHRIAEIPKVGKLLLLELFLDIKQQFTPK